MYKKVIFDCFDTLIDSGSSSVKAKAEILDNVGLNTDPCVFTKGGKA